MEIDERKEDVVEVFTEYLVNNGLKKVRNVMWFLRLRVK